jgi:twitching motility protein PilU
MEIKEVMEKSGPMGMQTFDMALYDLYKSGKISLDETLRNADAENNLRLKIELSEKGAVHAAAATSDDEDDKEKEETVSGKKDALSGLSLVEHEDDEGQTPEGAATFKLPEDDEESAQSTG